MRTTEVRSSRENVLLTWANNRLASSCELDAAGKCDVTKASEFLVPETGPAAATCRRDGAGNYTRIERDLRGRKHMQTIDLGANHQMALEVRPAHDPTREYGFVGVVVDTTNLEASIWTLYREGGSFHAKKTATI